MTQRTVVGEQPVEINAGQQWARRVAVPKLADGQCPVLALRARLHTPGGGGCNFVLQVLLDGYPLTQTPMRPRLLNKAPWFDPPNTKYHFSWYRSSQRGWMTIFSPDWERNWAGTGRDFEFLFDLSGLVAGGETTTLSFRYLNPYIPRALKLDRAPLVVDRVVVGAMKRVDVERMRADVQKCLKLRQVPVQADQPPDAKPGERPYEVVWSGRAESPRAQVGFDNLAGWTAFAVGDATVSLSASVDHLLWRKRLARLSYGGGKLNTTVTLLPPKPIPIRGRFDAANLWLYGALRRGKDRPLQVWAQLEDARGRDFAIDLGRVTSTYWGFQHGVLDARALAHAKFPMTFTALVIANCKVEGTRHVYLESLAFYRQRRRPARRIRRPRGANFPTSDDGMLPTPPEGVSTRVERLGQGAEFVSLSPRGILRFVVEPGRGCLAGVTARWNDGPGFRPMDGGGLSFDLGQGETRVVPGEAKLTSARLRRGRLVARWRLAKRGTRVRWEATYAVRGHTLVVDVRCDGGAATGLEVGQLSGLAAPRGIEVPYLMMGAKPGPWVACAGGLFVSVLPDWYHCDCSSIDSQVTPPKDNRIGLVRGTRYGKLTNGRRNDLRDRILVTVSPEFADTLPNARNPVSPNRQRLAPYTFLMSSQMTLNLYRILKRHGIDYLIPSDFARIFVKEYPEGFAMRWRPHPTLTIKQVQDYRHAVKDLGYLFGGYIDATDYFPLNALWDEDKVALKSDGDLRDGWYGNFTAKPAEMPGLVRAVGKRVKEHYPADCVYLDVHTNRGPWAVDFEAGVRGAGIARHHVIANADCIAEARKWYGSTISEGIYRWMYAGVCDMDYATLRSSKPAPDVPPLVDFDLLKIHPFEHGTMMGYSPSAFFSSGSDELGTLYRDTGIGPPPPAYYKYVSASLAYGHMLILGYGYIPRLSRFIHTYALFQGVQREYLTDTVAAIHYHDRRHFVSTSRALAEDSQKLGRVRVRYARGLVVHVNYNPDTPWTVVCDGRSFELPPYGWLIVKPGNILAYSALVNGHRVDFVRCPDYIYIHSFGHRATEGPLDVEGAVWLKRQGKGWRLIPCGDLGQWEWFQHPEFGAHYRDLRLVKTPPERGCTRIEVDTQALLGKASARVGVGGRNLAGTPAAAQVERPDARHLRIVPAQGVCDYLIE